MLCLHRTSKKQSSAAQFPQARGLHHLWKRPEAPTESTELATEAAAEAAETDDT
jgi:hypothetical protein